MSEEIEISEESLRKIAAQKVTFRYSVKIHAIIYILSNIFLFIINTIFTPDLWWAFYPLLGWLIGLAIHMMAYILYARGTRYAIRGILFHFTAWVFGMPLLVVTNYMTSGSLDWVIYPALFWSIGLVVHIVITLLLSSGKSEKKEVKTSRKERAIEKEIQKMRNRKKE